MKSYIIESEYKIFRLKTEEKGSRIFRAKEYIRENHCKKILVSDMPEKNIRICQRKNL